MTAITGTNELIPASRLVLRDNPADTGTLTVLRQMGTNSNDGASTTSSFTEVSLQVTKIAYANIPYDETMSIEDALILINNADAEVQAKVDELEALPRMIEVVNLP